MFSASPLSATGLLFLLLANLQPSAVLAAPQVGPAIPEAAAAVDLGERSLDPHYSCYSGGETLSSIGSSSKVDSIVKSACGKFADYNNHKFVVGSTVRLIITVSFNNLPRPSFCFSLVLCVSSVRSRKKKKSP